MPEQIIIDTDNIVLGNTDCNAALCLVQAENQDDCLDVSVSDCDDDFKEVTLSRCEVTVLHEWLGNFLNRPAK